MSESESSAPLGSAWLHRSNFRDPSCMKTRFDEISVILLGKCLRELFTEYGYENVRVGPASRTPNMSDEAATRLVGVYVRRSAFEEQN